MMIFHSYVNVYHRVNLHFPSFSHGFPMVFGEQKSHYQRVYQQNPPLEWDPASRCMSSSKPKAWRHSFAWAQAWIWALLGGKATKTKQKLGGHLSRAPIYPILGEILEYWGWFTIGHYHRCPFCINRWCHKNQKFTYIVGLFKGYTLYLSTRDKRTAMGTIGHLFQVRFWDIGDGLLLVFVTSSRIPWDIGIHWVSWWYQWYTQNGWIVSPQKWRSHGEKPA